MNKGRTAGFFYLLTVVFGPGLLISAKLIVANDAAATAANILANETLFRVCIVADILAGVAYIAVAALFYDLFKAVDERISVVAAFFGLAGSIIAVANDVFELAPLVMLKTRESQSLALLLFKVHGQGTSIAFVLFGVYCLLIGWLIYRSGFVPRILGAGMAIAGLCWLTSSLTTFLSPSIASHLFPYIMAGGLGEIALTVWLLVKGARG